MKHLILSITVFLTIGLFSLNSTINVRYPTSQAFTGGGGVAVEGVYNGHEAVLDDNGDFVCHSTECLPPPDQICYSTSRGVGYIDFTFLQSYC